MFFSRTFSIPVYTTNMEREKVSGTNAIGTVASAVGLAAGIVACHFSQKFIFEKFNVEPLAFYQSFIIVYAFAFLTSGAKIRVGLKDKK
jgi:hypothetical protein